MPYLIRCIPLLLISPGHLALADERSKVANIEELLMLIRADKAHEELVKRIVARQITPIPTAGTAPEARVAAEALQKKMAALISKALQWENVKQEYLKVYSDQFSE